MMVVINRPVFLQDKRCYEVKIRECSLRIRNETTTANLPIEFETNTEAANSLELFLNAFLEESKTFFSKPLDPDLFRYRLSHFWEGLDSCLPESGKEFRARVDWVPASILFYSNRYELHWEIAEFEELGYSDISGQVQQAESTTAEPVKREEDSTPESSGHPVEEHLTPVSAQQLPPPPVENPPDLLADAEVLNAIPFEESGQIVAGPANRSRERQRIRRARLKAALAQLRAERLAERYYDRYGTLAGIDGDSSLSSGSNSESESPQKQG